MTIPWQELPSVRDGVLARRQAMGRGMSEDLWQWKLDRGLWVPLLPGVVTLHNGEPTCRQQHWAGVLKAHPDAVLAGDAALLEYGFPFSDLGLIDVARPGTAGKTFEVRGGRRYVPHSVSRRDQSATTYPGLPIMEVVTATLYAAAWTSTPRAAEWRLATVVQRGLATAADLRQTLREMPSLPRRGLMLHVLDDVERGAHAMSELDFLRVCRTYQVPEPDELQVRVRAGTQTRYLDGCYRRPRVRFEVDGAHHRYVETWEADVLRSNDLALSSRGRDEIALRFTSGQVRHQGWLVARQLRLALAC